MGSYEKKTQRPQTVTGGLTQDETPRQPACQALRIRKLNSDAVLVLIMLGFVRTIERNVEIL